MWTLKVRLELPALANFQPGKVVASSRVDRLGCAGAARPQGPQAPENAAEARNMTGFDANGDAVAEQAAIRMYKARRGLYKWTENPLEPQLDDVHLIWLVLIVIFVLLAVGVAAISSLSSGPRR
jgi:hypothetical protein